MGILMIILVLIVLWSLFGVVFLTIQSKEEMNTNQVLTHDQWLWVLERDRYTCQFSQWDIPSKSFLICGDPGVHVVLIGSFPIRPSNHICICEKHAKWISETRKVSLETHLITSARERGKALAQTKSYPFE